MRLRFHSDFKKDYLKTKAAVADPVALDKNLKTLTRTLLAGEKLPAKYVTNKIITDGVGWYESFVYQDKKHTIIIQYKIQDEYLTLASIGSPDDLTQKRRILLKRT